MVGILGSGFGLYGYLPAVAGNSDINDARVALLERNKEKFSARTELSRFTSCIQWMKNEEELYENVDALIICTPPEKQVSIVKEALSFPNIKYFLLEKPLAVSPSQSENLLNLLINSKRSFRIGFNFRYTEWGKDLLNSFNNELTKKVKIEWHFKAYHYIHNLNNWKRYSNSGGGVIRFFGIHLIALTALLGECEVKSSVCECYSENEMYKWKLSVEVDGKHIVEIEIDSNSPKNKFHVEVESDNGLQENKKSYSLKDPFEHSEPAIDNLDRRIIFLKPIISDLFTPDQEQWNQVYSRINKFWSEIEQINIIT